MHYYTFNVGDYRKDTAHLSTLEHGIYRQLIDWYYLDEKPIPKETQVVLRRLRLASESDIQALQNVLADFFILQDDGYHQERCDAAIKEYKARADKNKANGKQGGRPKKTQSVISGNPIESESKGNQEPSNPTTQKPKNPSTILSEEALASLSPGLLACPQSEILALYAKHLPHLPQHRQWGADRQKSLRARWQEASKLDGYKTKEDGLAWWENFFVEFEASTIGHGFQKPDGAWVPDLDWILKKANFNKIIDGRYAQRAAQAAPAQNVRESFYERDLRAKREEAAKWGGSSSSPTDFLTIDAEVSHVPSIESH